MNWHSSSTINWSIPPAPLWALNRGAFQMDLEIPNHKLTAVDCASQLTSAGLLPHSCFDSSNKTSSSIMSCPTDHVGECQQGLWCALLTQRKFHCKKLRVEKDHKWAKFSKLSLYTTNRFSVMSLSGAKNPVPALSESYMRPMSKEVQQSVVQVSSQP